MHKNKRIQNINIITIEEKTTKSSIKTSYCQTTESARIQTNKKNKFSRTYKIERNPHSHTHTDNTASKPHSSSHHTETNTRSRPNKLKLYFQTATTKIDKQNLFLSVQFQKLPLKTTQKINCFCIFPKKNKAANHKKKQLKNIT